MSENRQASCEERIAAHMESREEQFGAILETPRTDDLHDTLRLAVRNEWDAHSGDEVETLLRRIDEGAPDDEVFDPADPDAGTIEEVANEWWDEAKDFLADRDTTEAMLNAPLAISTRIALRIELSTGGPGDWLEVGLDVDGYERIVEYVTYHFNDWFDHAERPVRDDSPLWQAAEWYAEIADIPGQDR